MDKKNTLLCMLLAKIDTFMLTLGNSKGFMKMGEDGRRNASGTLGFNFSDQSLYLQSPVHEAAKAKIQCAKTI